VVARALKINLGAVNKFFYHGPSLFAVSALAESDSFGSREQTAVDGVNDGLCTDLPTTKETPVETLDCVFAPLNLVEFEVDIALRIRVKGDVNNVTVLAFAFGTNVIFELLDPGVTFFPAGWLA